MVKTARLTKITGNDPPKKRLHQIYEGHSVTGILFQEPIVGQSCCVDDFCTSIVVSIDFSSSTFKTLNSTYKIEYLGEIKIKRYE